MIINSANLSALFTGYKTRFTSGFEGVKPLWPELATLVPSLTREEQYAWLGQFPRLREWIGDRVIQNLKAYGYTIENRKFEATIKVTRDEIEDDSYGIFGPLFSDMGASAATHPDELLFELLSRGFVEKCYDGHSFFNKAHPVGQGGTGDSTVANCQLAEDGKAKSPWFLLDTSRALKPFIFQKRRDYSLTSITTPSNERVFMTDEFLYGVDARVSMGFGFWQQAYGSNCELNAENFDAAYASMTTLSSDEGRPLGIRPTILLCGTSNRKAAFNIAQASILTGNVPNPNFELVRVVTTQYLP